MFNANPARCDTELDEICYTRQSILYLISTPPQHGLRGNGKFWIKNFIN